MVTCDEHQHNNITRFSPVSLNINVRLAHVFHRHFDNARANPVITNTTVSFAVSLGALANAYASWQAKPQTGICMRSSTTTWSPCSGGMCQQLYKHYIGHQHYWPYLSIIISSSRPKRFNQHYKGNRHYSTGTTGGPPLCVIVRQLRGNPPGVEQCPSFPLPLQQA